MATTSVYALDAEKNCNWYKLKIHLEVPIPCNTLHCIHCKFKHYKFSEATLSYIITVLLLFIVSSQFCTTSCQATMLGALLMTALAMGKTIAICKVSVELLANRRQQHHSPGNQFARSGIINRLITWII